MKLITFRVQNFRSVNDSGTIRADDLTALVGRNESGKSNLLLALESLNPAGGRKALSAIKNFPRHRRLDECDDETLVVESTWELDDEEQESLTELFPAAKGVRQVEIGRYYDGSAWVQIPASVPKPDHRTNRATLRQLDAQVTVAIEASTPDHQTAVRTRFTAFQAAVEAVAASDWAAKVTSTAKELRMSVVRASVALPDTVEALLTTIEDQANEVTSFATARNVAKKTILEWLPLFVYVADFPELDGHQNLAEYVTNRSRGVALTDSEKNFEKLAKVAGFKPRELHQLSDHETRNQLVNRAGATVTGEIRRLWKDRKLKIRFNLDAEHLDTLISDPNNVYDVEVNLNERSRGFQWFFSFYVTFAADTAGGNADGAILLLDEPGLYLHAASQGDLLKYLREDLKNQIIYTTHSPFMVPSDAINLVRTVSISQEGGTTVTNDPSGDSRTLFPLQAALGYHASQTLFIGQENLVVEGVTDFWILSAVNEHLRAVGGKTLPEDLIITPAAGAQRVTYMVALLASQRLDVLVLLDSEKAGLEAKAELLSNKLIRDNNVVFVSEAFSSAASVEADIEDLLDAGVYETLVRETYKSELRGKKLALNPNIPRIVKRMEDAFKALGLAFQKTRPARLFMTQMGHEPEKVLPSVSRGRFEQIFQVIADRLEKHKKSGRSPFR